MTKPQLQPERITAADSARPPAGEILEIRNVTLKQAIQLVRSLATASPQAQQTESDRSN
jgi:hypothetical protein